MAAEGKDKSYANLKKKPAAQFGSAGKPMPKYLYAAVLDSGELVYDQGARLVVDVSAGMAKERALKSIGSEHAKVRTRRYVLESSVRPGGA